MKGSNFHSIKEPE
jgi:hypothetical protein